MKRKLPAALILACCQMFGQTQSSNLPEGAGKATMQRVCSGCHAPEIVLGRHETREGWEGVVGNMVERGANGTDEEFNTIIDYLAANFSKDKIK